MAINTSPIGSRLRWALLPEESLNEQATGVASGGTVGSVVTLPEGKAYVPAASQTTWATPSAEIDPFLTSITIVWYGRIDDDGVSVLARYVYGYGWYLQSDPWDVDTIFLKLGTWWAGGQPGAVITLTDDTVHHLAVRFNKPTSTIDIFVDGTLHTGGIAWAPDGDGTNGAVGPNGVFSMQNTTASAGCITCQIYEGALSNGEIASLASGPMQVFLQPPLSASIDTTDEDDALDAFGLVVTVGPVDADVASTDEPDTLIATATSTVAASVNYTDDDDLLISGDYNPYSRLIGILNDTPLHTWVQVNTTRYVDCQMQPSDWPYNSGTPMDHVRIVIPWSGFAFDHDRGNLLLWGGGHANYIGNELYQWHADTGEWSLACLPSKVDGNPNTLYVVDKKAPQSSHTYQNNFWLKVNGMFGTFGGAAAPGGGPPLEDHGGSPRRVAPWLYDLEKTDPEKVGGSDGSGMNPARLGLNAWRHRRDNVPTGTWTDGNVYPIDYGGHASQAAVEAVIDGKDGVCFTFDANSGFPHWFRYNFGDIRAGENDTITWLGRTSSSIVFEGWGVYDPKRGFMYRNAYAKHASYPTVRNELVAKYALTAGVPDFAINLADEFGDPFDMNPVTTECPYGACYDPINDVIWLRGGTAPDTGIVHYIEIPEYTPGAGWASTTWTVRTITPPGPRPHGLYQTPILGKIKHVPEIGALIILDRASSDGSVDPGVWVFKTSEYAPPQPPAGAFAATAEVTTSFTATLSTQIGFAATFIADTQAVGALRIGADTYTAAWPASLPPHAERLWRRAYPVIHPIRLRSRANPPAAALHRCAGRTKRHLEVHAGTDDGLSPVLEEHDPVRYGMVHHDPQYRARDGGLRHALPAAL